MTRRFVEQKKRKINRESVRLIATSSVLSTLGEKF